MIRALRLFTLSAFLLAPAARGDAIDDAFALWTGSDRPGCALAITQGNGAQILRAYGMADLERGVPVSAQTVFETGSVAKQFTAASVLMLVEDGKLALGDDIRRYLPEMPDYGVPITIDHLLTHMSGLRDWGDIVDFSGWPRYSRAYSNSDALLVASRQRALNHRPGERFAYTNTGYNLLAVIVERVSGQSLAAFTQERIFTPLGMERSGWRDDYRRIVPDRAVGYTREDDRLLLGIPMENAYGSGGMLTNVVDLLKWLAALDKGTLGPFVTGKLQEVAHTEQGQPAAYGRGLVLGTFRGQREIFHNGGTNGYQAWLGRYPEQGLGIAMLCNGRTVGPDTQARKVAGLFLPPEPERTTSALPDAAELEARVGLYVGEGPFDLLELVAGDGRLRTVGGTALEFLAPGRYRLGTSELRFMAQGLERHRDGGVQLYVRENRVTPLPADLAMLVGTYSSEEANGSFRLEMKDGALVLTPGDRPDGAVRLTALFRDGFKGSGYLMRILRDRRGRVEGLRFQTPRVYKLDFKRSGPAQGAPGRS
ncbi:serine hydrolase domain-containing protein [Niveispirillum sp. KHB5.9]|uniref:serine hydrolase domain-containing protein n=1 Tax=Niveispirillum sp. KHB5.9 TaxID=3400269 RepID=UPI003A89FB0C